MQRVAITMAPPKSNRERDLVRKLRVEDGKSFGEIAQLTGFNKSTICRWAQAEGWPDPNKPHQDLKKILDSAPQKKSAPAEPPGPPKQPGDKFVFPENLPEVDFKAEPEILNRQIYNWAMEALMAASRFSVSALVKVAEISARVHIATHTPKPGEFRRLTVMIPGTVESYRHDPDSDG